MWMWWVLEYFDHDSFRYAESFHTDMGPIQLLLRLPAFYSPLDKFHGVVWTLLQMCTHFPCVCISSFYYDVIIPTNSNKRLKSLTFLVFVSTVEIFFHRSHGFWPIRLFNSIRYSISSAISFYRFNSHVMCSPEQKETVWRKETKITPNFIYFPSVLNLITNDHQLNKWKKPMEIITIEVRWWWAMISTKIRSLF